MINETENKDYEPKVAKIHEFDVKIKGKNISVRYSCDDHVDVQAKDRASFEDVDEFILYFNATFEKYEDFALFINRWRLQNAGKKKDTCNLMTKVKLLLPGRGEEDDEYKWVYMPMHFTGESRVVIDTVITKELVDERVKRGGHPLSVNKDDVLITIAEDGKIYNGIKEAVIKRDDHFGRTSAQY